MVRMSRMLLKNGVNKFLSETLVCPLTKNTLRYCENTNSFISEQIGVSFPVIDGIPCLYPKDGKILEYDDGSSSYTNSSASKEGQN